MRVIVVDDEELARVLLREFLAGHPDVEIVAECGNGFEAVKAVMEKKPTCWCSACRCRSSTGSTSSS